jgi:hypothetical protein
VHQRILNLSGGDPLPQVAARFVVFIGDETAGCAPALLNGSIACNSTDVEQDRATPLKFVSPRKQRACAKLLNCFRQVQSGRLHCGRLAVWK